MITGPIGYYFGGLNSLSHPMESEDSNAWFERDASNQGYYYFKDVTANWSGYDRWADQGINYFWLFNLLFAF